MLNSFFYKKSHILWPLVFLMVVLPKCKIDDELDRLKKTDWSPEFALPLVYADLKISDFLVKHDHTLVQQKDDGLLYLYYRGEVSSFYADQIISLLEQTIRVHANRESVELGLSEQHLIETIAFRSGGLQFKLEGKDISEIAYVEISMPSLILQGQPMHQFRIYVNQLSKPISLAGALVDFLEAGNKQIQIDFRVFNNAGEDITEGFELVMRFVNLKWRIIRGWFSDLVIDLSSDSIKLDLFEQWKSGKASFIEPKVRLDFFNSFGVPVRASVSTFMAHSNRTGALPMDVDLGELGEVLELEYSGDPLNLLAHSSYVLHEDNSNIGGVISLTPSVLVYKFDIYAKHDVNTDEIGEIHDTSRIRLATEVEIPLRGSLDNMVGRDTVPIQSAFPKELNRFRSLALNISTYNSMPVGMWLQLYTLNNAGVVIDSLFEDPRFLEAPSLDANGRVMGEESTQTRIEFSEEAFERLKRMRSVAIRTKLETSGQGAETVSIYGDQGLRLFLNLEARYKIQ